VEEEAQTIEIRDVSAIGGSDIEAAASALAQADLAATAVGVPVLPKVAPSIAAGITKRFQSPDAPPLDIIVCENMIDAGPFLREEVRRLLTKDLHAALDERVGFVEASIGRMVPVMTEAQRAEDPLLVCVEAYCELPVDATAFRGPIPELAHLKAHRDFGAYVERKLFVHNASHAATAYLGYHRGYEYIWQAIGDPIVFVEVRSALAESCAALHSKHGMERAALEAHADDLLRRYRNKGLADQVTRVARDPIRKLGPKDRLIGAMRLCEEQSIAPAALAFATAAAIRYDHSEDPAAQQIQAQLQSEGLTAVLQDICGLEAQSTLVAHVQAAMERLDQEGWLRDRNYAGN
jgi:mannitol-1-phosphate 5-dehydrogenase